MPASLTVSTHQTRPSGSGAIVLFFFVQMSSTSK